MATKREVERNEKIIRGLMKLPPNRRCINCNSLGPQYVCTNFWTFVCMICSGIHREFTHRVKSVSMSKFTSQEVEALQNGGNQRAREIYLKDWDLDRQRQPNISNVDKVRNFIKAVYIDHQYAGGNNSEKSPQDMQVQRSLGDETRRASSYHSFSQSPPYDFQYEDRLNRNHTGSLTRKPSDLIRYGRKAASFIYSPRRFSEHVYEDRFANEGSTSRASDYSSSSCYPCKSEPQSPNLQKDDGFGTPTSGSSRGIVDGLHCQTSGTYSEIYAKRDIENAPLPQPQRTVSSGSTESFEKNFMSRSSVDSGNLFDVSSELNHSNVTAQNKTFTIPAPSQLPVEDYGGLNLFEDALAMAAPNSAAGVDLFLSQKTGPALSENSPPSSCSSYSTSQNPPTSNPNVNLPEPSEPSNEVWATFDLPQPSPPGIKTKDFRGSGAESGGSSLESFHPVAPSIAGLQWRQFQNPRFQSPPALVSNPWNEDLQNVHVPNNMASSQIWKPFEDANEQLHQFVDTQGVNFQASIDNASSSTDLVFAFQTSKNSGVDGLQQIASSEGFSFPPLPSHVSSRTSFVEPTHPFTSDIFRQNSGNPFDVPFDSELEANNTFLDMSTLQAALPLAPPSSSYMGGINNEWFPGNPVASPGGMSYISTQAHSSQLQSFPTHGSVASVGGNPFA